MVGVKRRAVRQNEPSPAGEQPVRTNQKLYTA